MNGAIYLRTGAITPETAGTSLTARKEIKTLRTIMIILAQGIMMLG